MYMPESAEGFHVGQKRSKDLGNLRSMYNKSQTIYR